MLEEACEVAQACGVKRFTAQAVVESVYNKPASNDLLQEADGLATTFAAFCECVGIDNHTMHMCACATP